MNTPEIIGAVVGVFAISGAMSATAVKIWGNGRKCYEKHSKLIEPLSIAVAALDQKRQDTAATQIRFDERLKRVEDGIARLERMAEETSKTVTTILREMPKRTGNHHANG
jgi:hypothetical protein